MTDEERKEAVAAADQAMESLEQAFNDDFEWDAEHETRRKFVELWLAGRESMRAEMDRTSQLYKNKQDQVSRFVAKIEAERARSEKLLKALEFYAAMPSGTGLSEGVINGGESVPLGTTARIAIADYKASR